MKIVFDGRILNLAHAGIAEYLLNLLVYLKKQSINCVLISPKEIRSTPYLDGIEIVDVSRFRTTSSKDMRFENLATGEFVSEIKAEIYHAPSNWGIPQNLTCPSVLTIHDIIPFKIKEAAMLDPHQFKRYKELIMNSAKMASKIIAVSRFSKKDIISTLQLPPSKIKVVYNGFTLPKKPKDFRKQSVLTLSSFGIKKDYLLAAGGLYKRKNILRIIRTFAKLKQKEKLDYQLVILGENKNYWYIEKQFIIYQKEIEKYNLKKEVVFPGYLDRKTFDIFLFNAKLLLYPSLYEGFGLPILEGMAAGVPVITSNITALPEIAGGAAHLVNPYKEEEIYEGVKKILSNEQYRKELIKKGKKRILDFSWNKMGKETLELYNQILEGAERNNEN